MLLVLPRPIGNEDRSSSSEGGSRAEGCFIGVGVVPCYPGLSNKEKLSVLLFFFPLNKGFVSSCPRRVFFLSVKMGTVDLCTQPSICAFCRASAASFLLKPSLGVWVALSSHALTPVHTGGAPASHPQATRRGGNRGPRTGGSFLPPFPGPPVRTARAGPAPLPIGRLSRRHRPGTGPPVAPWPGSAGPTPAAEPPPPTDAAAAPGGGTRASQVPRGRGRACAEARGGAERTGRAGLGQRRERRAGAGGRRAWWGPRAG